jgi:hypothetical protein
VDCVGHPTHLFVADVTELIGFREHGIKRVEGTYESLSVVVSEMAN